MAIAYFDCYCGAGGDMIVASLLDAGASFDALTDALASLSLPGVTARCEQVRRCGIAASRFCVDVPPDEQPHRHLPDILAAIEGSALSPRAKQNACDVFGALGQAEAKVHGVPVEKIHFHEVGAADSIFDIVGAAVALDLLGIDEILVGPIPLGSGTIRCDHGLLPVPAPATAELLTGAITTPGPASGELTTPTAAALFTTLGKQTPLPEMTLRQIGYGAGTREIEGVANVLRVLIGEPAQAGTADAVVELNAHIDDCSGEVLGATLETLRSSGCLDAWATPAVGKKSRPAWILTALCEPANAASVEERLFRETTTLGIRRHLCQRRKLERLHQSLETPFGPIRIKLGLLDGEVVTAQPEFADCLAAARSHNAPVKQVIQATKNAFDPNAKLKDHGRCVG